MHIYMIECEWDIGNDGLAFSTKDGALRWVNENLILREMASNEGAEHEQYLEDLYEDGYLQIRDLFVSE